MDDSPKKKGSTSPSNSQDSGYGGSPSRSLEKLLEKGNPNEKTRKFKELLRIINSLELSIEENKKEKQVEAVNQRFYSGRKVNENVIRDEYPFMITNISIRETYRQTKLERNEGAFFLTIAKSCLNKEVLKSLVEAIWIESKELKKATKNIKKEDSETKEQDIKLMLESYIDKDGYNVLHCLADNIVKKHENNFAINKSDWEAFEYFSEIAPKLREQEDFLDRKPLEIITEQTNITTEQENTYII